MALGVGRRSAFEVVLDGKWLIFSKLAMYAFPDPKLIAQLVAKYAQTGEHEEGWTKL